MSKPAENRRPNVLLVLTDQLRYPPPYESEELAAYRREHCPGQERLRENGVSFRHHYPMAAACAPSRASLLTGHYPSLHGVTQTDGLAKSADSDDMFWLAPDTVPTLGDWFRAGGYRTYFKGKWHASHAHLDADDGDGLPALDRRRRHAAARRTSRSTWRRTCSTTTASRSGSGPSRTGSASTTPARSRTRSPPTRRSRCCERLDGDESDEPWLTVCSFLNPHDDSLFGVIALTQGLRYHPSTVPHVEQAPTHDEDLSTKPACQQSMVDLWGKILAPQPWIETHLKFYYQLQATVDEQITRVLDALRGERRVREHDRGLQLRPRRHAGRPRRDAREVARRLRGGAARAVRRLQPAAARRRPRARRPDQPRRPDPDAARPRRASTRTRRSPELQADHTEARPLVGRDLSDAIRAAEPAAPSEPILFTTDDEISEGSVTPASPFQRVAQAPARGTRRSSSPTTSRPSSPRSTSTASRTSSSSPATTTTSSSGPSPASATSASTGRKTITVTEPEPDEYELYDLTARPVRGTQPRPPDARRRPLPRARSSTMLGLLVEQLAAKRLVPDAGEVPGYRPPVAPVKAATGA